MNQEDYLIQRVDDQINWYDNKSQWNQKLFKRLRVFEIVIAALIPLLSGYVYQYKYMDYTIAILGLVIVIIAGLLTLYKFQENWTSYRTISETLKHEKFLFMTKTEPYNNERAFSLFVQRVESHISKENSQWLSIISNDKENLKQS